MAGFCRFFGGYSIGFWGATFFEKVYPNYSTYYSVGNAIISIGAGIPAELMGGYLSDKYEQRFPKIKAYIAGFGALTSCIFIVFVFIIQINFWVSIVCLYFAYITAEAWYGPSFSMINIILPSEIQGLAIAIFGLTGAISGALGTFILGILGDKYEIDQYPERTGPILGAAVLTSYISCAPFFLLTAREYSKILASKNN